MSSWAADGLSAAEFDEDVAGREAVFCGGALGEEARTTR